MRPKLILISFLFLHAACAHSVITEPAEEESREYTGPVDVWFASDGGAEAWAAYPE